MYNINDILEFLGFKYKIEECSILLKSSYSHMTGVDTPKYTYYFKEHGYPRPQVEGLFVDIFKRLQDVRYEPVNNKYCSIDNKIGLLVTEDKILLYRLLDDNEPTTREHDIEQFVAFRIVPRDRYTEWISYSLLNDISEAKPDPDEELTEEFFNIQERIERGNKMKKYEIADSDILYFRDDGIKVCAASIIFGDTLRIVNIHPKIKWDIFDLKSFINIALKEFNKSSDIDKHLESLKNEKVYITDLSANNNELLIRYGRDGSFNSTLKSSEGIVEFDDGLLLDIKSILCVLDYITDKYSIETLTFNKINEVELNKIHL